MKQRHTLPGIALCCLIVLLGVVQPAHAAPPPKCILAPDLPSLGYASGSGYVVALTVGGLIPPVDTGPLFSTELGCDEPETHRVNGITDMSLDKYVTVNALKSEVTILRTTSSVGVAEAASVGDISLFDGKIKADAVTARATSIGTYAGAKSSNTSTFINLVIAGRKIQAEPPPNFTLALPGVGKIVLNEQTLNDSDDATDISVTAIDIELAFPNVLGIPAGGRVRVAHVEGSFKRSPQ